MRFIFSIFLVLICFQLFSQAPPILGDNNQNVRADDDCIYQVTVPSTSGSWYFYDTGPSGIAQFRVLGGGFMDQYGSWGTDALTFGVGDTIQARFPTGVIGTDLYSSDSNTGAITRSSTANASTACCLFTDPNVSCISLPVTWLEKTSANLIDNKIQITWSVASQINNEKFIIEHSTKGDSFQSIGQISGDGDHNGVKEYEYVDDSPSKGINYYRVKQIDYDGKYEYSNIASVIFKSDEISLYPNPVSGILTVNSSLEDKLELYNHLGQAVLSRTINEGQNKIDISHLSGGVYYARFGPGNVGRILKE